MKASLVIAGIEFPEVELPDADTPLPPDSNHATIHVLLIDDRPHGSTVLCGFTTQPIGRWPWGHKWIGATEYQWLKHVNCPQCLALMKGKDPNALEPI